MMRRFTFDSVSEFLFSSCVHLLVSGLLHLAIVDEDAWTRELRRAENFASSFEETLYAIAHRWCSTESLQLPEIFGDQRKSSDGSCGRVFDAACGGLSDAEDTTCKIVVALLPKRRWPKLRLTMGRRL